MPGSLPSPDTPGITVAICTRNRAEILGDAIASACRELATDPGLEVLVVDNASTDGTRAVAKEACKRHSRVRLALEPSPGLSRARNRALRAAAGSVVVFLDDDALLHPGYASLLRAAWNELSPVAVGGPISVEYLDPEPPWWTPDFASYCGAFDLGKEVRELRFSQYPQGSNIALDRKAALEAGGFDELLGVGPRGPWSGEEIELCARLQRRGGRIFYHPGLRVTHRVSRSRRTRWWLLRAAFYRGRSHFYSTRSFEPTIRWRAFVRAGLGDALAAFPWMRLRARARLALAAGMLLEASTPWKHRSPHPTDPPATRRPRKAPAR